MGKGGVRVLLAVLLFFVTLEVPEDFIVCFETELERGRGISVGGAAERSGGIFFQACVVVSLELFPLLLIRCCCRCSQTHCRDCFFLCCGDIFVSHSQQTPKKDRLVAKDGFPKTIREHGYTDPHHNTPTNVPLR